MDRRHLIAASLYTFATAGAYIVARATTDALFLSRAGVEWLPLVFLASAILLGGTSGLLSKLTTRAPLRRVIMVTLFGLAFSTILLCQLIQYFGESIWLLAAVYLLAELRGCLNSIQYGILLNELFANRPEFHESNGRVGAAATVAGIGFGVLVGMHAGSISLINMLYMAAGLELLAMVPIAFLPKHFDRRKSANTRKGKRIVFDARHPLRIAKRGLNLAATSARTRHIAYLVAFAVIVTSLIDFQWKSSIAHQFSMSESGLASFLGWVYAGIGLASFVIQVLFTGKILHRFRHATLLSVLPVALFVTCAFAMFAGTQYTLFVAMIAVRYCDVLKRSVNIPVILSLYSPMDAQNRRHAIVWVTGIVKPIAEVVGALVVLLLAWIGDPSYLIYITLILLCGWIDHSARSLRLPKLPGGVSASG